MFFQRQQYLDKLITGRGNGLVKIVTGGRRCGKSFLLFTIFLLVMRFYSLNYSYTFDI